jgi:hypothetical protein
LIHRHPSARNLCLLRRKMYGAEYRTRRVSSDYPNQHPDVRSAVVL